MNRSMLTLFKLSRQVKPRQVKTPLGQWNIHKETLKHKYANEDNSFKTDPLDKNYMYMMGYESAHK